MSFIEFCKVAGTLSKLRISLPVTATTFTGYIIYSGELSPMLFPLLAGVFLLAAGSSALNHYQERKTDALMERTHNRPLPGKLVSPRFAVLFSLVALSAGTLILLIFISVPVVLLGLFNVFWYNAVYTNLKKVTAFAVIPGSVTGGVPPMIGWVAAGGDWLDTAILVVVLFFIIGQIPHFWLIVLRYGKQYEVADLPSLTTVFSSLQIKRLSHIWILTTLAASALLPAYGLIRSSVVLVFYLVSALILLLITLYSFFHHQEKVRKGLLFTSLNIFYLVIMCLLAADNLLMKI